MLHSVINSLQFHSGTLINLHPPISTRNPRALYLNYVPRNKAPTKSITFGARVSPFLYPSEILQQPAHQDQKSEARRKERRLISSSSKEGDKKIDQRVGGEKGEQRRQKESQPLYATLQFHFVRNASRLSCVYLTAHCYFAYPRATEERHEDNWTVSYRGFPLSLRRPGLLWDPAREHCTSPTLYRFHPPPRREASLNPSPPFAFWAGGIVRRYHSGRRIKGCVPVSQDSRVAWADL